MGTSYFYSCSLPLEIDSIVMPGNWGRMIKIYTPQSGHPWLMIRELIFEQIRKESYPTKPSRFGSLFLCPTLEGMKNFIKQRQWDLIYEVTLVDSKKPFHIGDMALCDLNQSDNYEVFVKRANDYWKEENPKIREIVTESPVRIIRKI